jgi:hypothetical protein
LRPYLSISLPNITKNWLTAYYHKIGLESIFTQILLYNGVNNYLAAFSRAFLMALYDPST